MKGTEWDKKELNSEVLKKDFNHGLVAILQKGKRKAPMERVDRDEQLRETTEHCAENEDEDVRAPTPKYQKISHLNENPTEKEEFPSLPDQTTREEIKFK